MNSRVQLFNFEVDALDMGGAVSRVLGWASRSTGPCKFVVTPNVDHAVLLQHHEGLRRAYRDAALILADGNPVVWAARLLRRPLPERVPGSDLVPRLFQSANSKGGLRVYLLGAAPGVADKAAAKIQSRWPHIQVVGTYSPPLGFESDEKENREILRRIAEAAPQILVVGLGAPKQELWVHRHQELIHAPVALCVGATIDFLAGQKKRAPRWMQQTGLEWLHRMLGEPRRLAARYARDAWIFPQMVWREWRLEHGKF